MKYVSLLTASLLAPLAHAGQQFSFSDPIPSGSYSNYMFETSTLFPENGNTTASIVNAYTGNVTLTVDNFTATGAYTGTTKSTARYFLSKTGLGFNDSFGGGITSGVYAAGAGSIIFVDTGVGSPTLGTVLFQATFTGSTLSYSPLTTTKVPTIENLSATPTGLGFSGSLFRTTETGSPNAGFGLVDRFTQGAGTDPARHTGVFYASIGTIGVVSSPVPEPAPLAALAGGTLVLLRRRRRA